MSADLHVVRTRPSLTAASSVEVLREVLVEAEAGLVSSVCVALVRPCGAVNAYTSDSEQVGALLGALAAAQVRLVMESG